VKFVYLKPYSELKYQKPILKSEFLELDFEYLKTITTKPIFEK